MNSQTATDSWDGSHDSIQLTIGMVWMVWFLHNNKHPSEIRPTHMLLSLAQPLESEGIVAKKAMEGGGMKEILVLGDVSCEDCCCCCRSCWVLVIVGFISGMTKAYNVFWLPLFDVGLTIVHHLGRASVC